MKKIEKIAAVGGFVVGISLLGIGMYMDRNPPKDYDFYKGVIIKGTGLVLFGVGSGLSFKDSIEQEDKRYIEENKKYLPSVK
jgi:hypothetical protein